MRDAGDALEKLNGPMTLARWMRYLDLWRSWNTCGR